MFEGDNIYGHVNVITNDSGARVAIELAAFAGGAALKQDDHDDRFWMAHVFGLSFLIDGGEDENAGQVSIDMSSRFRDATGPIAEGPGVDVSDELVRMLKKHEYFRQREVITLREWHARRGM